MWTFHPLFLALESGLGMMYCTTYYVYCIEEVFPVEKGGSSYEIALITIRSPLMK